MKRILIVLSVILATITLSSCEDEIDTKSGKVFYSYGFANMHGDPTETHVISEAYTAEFNKIPGITIENSSFTMEGRYSDTDEQVKKACSAAEKTLANETFTGTYTFRVSAVYFENSFEDENFYRKEYGNKE